MSGGVGFTQYATAAYTDNILEDYTTGPLTHQEQVRWARQEQADPGTRSTSSELRSTPMRWSCTRGTRPRWKPTSVAPSAPLVAAAALVSLGDGHWQRERRCQRLVSVHAPAQGEAGRARLLRLRPAGPMRFHRTRSPYRTDEGLLDELRGPNYPNYAMNVGHLGGYAGIAAAPHAARGDAFACNPLIKIASPTSRWSSTSPSPAASSRRAPSASSCPRASAPSSSRPGKVHPTQLFFH